MARRLTGAIGIAGRVYRAGQEAELEAAASYHGVDLSRPRLAALFEGDEPAVVSAESEAANDLKVRAALDTAGVTRGVQQTIKEVAAAKLKPRKPAAPAKKASTKAPAKKGK